jgi:hypothetical protein
LENHIKELELYNKIKEFFKAPGGWGPGNVLLTLELIEKIVTNYSVIN